MTTFLRSDTILRRQGRTARARRIANLSQPGFQHEKSLNIIMEEDEYRTSSRPPSPSSSCSGTSGSSSSSSAIKAQRRRANVSDIKIARSLTPRDSNDLLKYESPRAAPIPPSPQPSIDSFRLAFEAVAPYFPSPPSPFGIDAPESPTSSMSSSPRSRTGEMPLTPTSSDEEGSYINPYHVEIHPLVITKHSQRQVSPFDEVVTAQPPMKEASVLEECESDLDSDFEWYNQELSNMITLRSPLPPSFPSHKISRPDSIISITPTSKCLASKGSPTPSTPPTSPSKTGLSASMRRRSARRSVIPNYPPPPPPVEKRPASVSSNSSLVDFPMYTPLAPPTAIHRPLPRSSVPAECVFDDSSSAFSFSMYEVDLGDGRSASSGSVYSQPSFDAFAAHDVAFDMDGGMMLPVSLPATPNDVDIDSELTDWAHDVEFVFDEEDVHPSPSANVYTPSFPPSPSLSYYHSSASGSPSPPAAGNGVYREEHTLKSKWSTSTLASVHEEHARRGPSAKLRLYFGGGQSSSSKRGSAQSTKKAAVPPTPTSPFSALMSPRKANRGGHVRGSSDLIPYGSTVGVRRRGSVATISDAGSEESSSSTSSTGRRRKPIPIEMFLRSSQL